LSRQEGEILFSKREAIQKLQNHRDLNWHERAYLFLRFGLLNIVVKKKN
jgi:hypothetical protein